MLALERALTENRDGFLKGFVPQKTKRHSSVRHQHDGCGALRRLEAGAVHQDALKSVWLTVVPACLSVGLHGLCVLDQHGHWEIQLCTESCLPVFGSMYVPVWEPLLYLNPMLLLV